MVYGTLTIKVGSMFSGKTTNLLKNVLWSKAGLNKNIKVFKPAFDNRYAELEIVSHDGLRANAESILEWKHGIELVGSDQLALNPDMVFFDEIQFFVEPYFKGDIVEIIKQLLDRGIHVYVSGLDMDWQGNPFDITAKLLAMADDVEKLTANCNVCGAPARKTYKKTQDGGSVELGTTDIYESRCNRHWKE